MLPVLLLVAALLYSSVGHAGGSGYLAAMAFAGVAQEVMKPSALVLNILVASITTIVFVRAGCFSLRLLLPFALGSVPMAMLGGSLQVSLATYRGLVAVVLAVAAVRLWQHTGNASKQTRVVPIPLAILCGAVIGLLAGTTGTGGGIFLTPLLLFTGWGDARQARGVSAAFILLNSLAGLAGAATRGLTLAPELWLWLACTGIGGLVGASLGARWIPTTWFRRLLALVLVIAAGKLLWA